jgi:HTH-like domain
MTAKGLSERRSLRVIGMSASALRYQPRPDRNGALRDRIVALAQRHRRYGASMIYLKLRQAGELVNHKRVERLIRCNSCRSGGVGARKSQSASASRRSILATNAVRASIPPSVTTKQPSSPPCYASTRPCIFHNR